MTPEVSRAIALVKGVLDLEDSQLTGLIRAGNKAKTVEDLPKWARNVLAYAAAKEPKQ